MTDFLQPKKNEEEFIHIHIYVGIVHVDVNRLVPLVSYNRMHIGYRYDRQRELTPLYLWPVFDPDLAQPMIVV